MTGEGNEMTPRVAKVNGTSIAYRVAGAGRPLVLVMGYRPSSLAWPAAFVEALASQFMVITMDNRGTGRSNKPVQGYAIANMARDVCGLLDELEIPRAHLLGYSMGGAIAQEFVRQFPKRVLSLILCATMCGGAEATYANAAVKPSEQLDRPYAMVGVNIIAAGSDDEARRLATTQQISFANIFRGARGLSQPPIENIESYWSPAEKAQAMSMLARSIVGSPDTIRSGIDALIKETGADELMIVSDVYDHANRLRSFELIARAASIAS
jgi:pimeloyl-ACP methyl ester carboxylesterase